MNLKLPKIFQNKFVLYGVTILAIGNVFGYLAKEQYNTVTFFLAVGLLTSYFSKNMTIVLLITIIATGIFSTQKFIEGFREGMEPTAEEKAAKEKAEKAAAAKPAKPAKVPVEEEKPPAIGLPPVDPNKAALDSAANAQNAAAATLEAPKKCFKKGTDGKWMDDTQFTGEKTCLGVAGNCWNTAAAKCPMGFSNMKKANNISNASKPARVDGEDDYKADRIDHAETMHQAYDNLQKMLGADGMKGLASETKNLVAQQKELVDSLGQMAPVLNSAKSTLDSLNLPDMKGITNILSTLKGGK